MDHDEELELTLRRLSPRGRAALAAACAERTVLLMELCLAHKAARRAINLTWQFAEGLRVDANDMIAEAANCEHAIDSLYDELDTGFLLRGAFASLWALRCAHQRGDVDSAHRACMAVLEASTTDLLEPNPETIRQEQEWQQRAAAVIRATSDGDLRREILGTLSEDPPWAVDYLARYGIVRSET